MKFFGPSNFVANLIWQSRTSISNDHPISPNHNHTPIYARERKHLGFSGNRSMVMTTKTLTRTHEVHGNWSPQTPISQAGNTRYPITNPQTGKDYWPPERIWAINEQRYEELLADGRIMFGKRGLSAPKKKIFLAERRARGDTKTPSSILLDAGTTKDGTTEVMALFDGLKVFDYPEADSLHVEASRVRVYAQ